MAEVIFFIAAIGAIAGAIGVTALRNPFYSVLALVSHLLCLAALFLLLRSEFIAAAQVVVYAGAVMVLYVFVVAYVGGVEELGSGGSRARHTSGGRGLKVVAGIACGALLVELCIAFLGSGLKAIDSNGAGLPAEAGFGSPEQIGEALLTKFLFPFEAASILLLLAAVGAVILARRRRGEDNRELESLRDIPLTRPAYSGTTAEAVGGKHALERPAAGATSDEPIAIGRGRREDDDRGGW